MTSGNTGTTDPSPSNPPRNAQIPFYFTDPGSTRNVPLDFSVEELKQVVRSDAPVVNMRRTITLENNTCIENTTLEVLFIGNVFPEKVSFCRLNFKVSPNVKSPQMYFNCLRFGRSTKFCRSKPRCAKCKGSHSRDKHDSMNSVIDCLHRGGNYSTFEKSCPSCAKGSTKFKKSWRTKIFHMYRPKKLYKSKLEIAGLGVTFLRKVLTVLSCKGY